MDKLLDRCFSLGDLVYIHSGPFKRSIGKIHCFETYFIAVTIKEGLAYVRLENLKHYTKGQEIYPGQFAVYEENTKPL